MMTPSNPNTAMTKTWMAWCLALLAAAVITASPAHAGVGLAELPGQQGDVGIELRNRQCAHQFARSRHGAEAGQRLELVEGHQQLGLVAAVAVVADRRVQRHAQPVLAQVTLDRLLGAGMGLQ